MSNRRLAAILLLSGFCCGLTPITASALASDASTTLTAAQILLQALQTPVPQPETATTASSSAPVAAGPANIPAPYAISLAPVGSLGNDLTPQNAILPTAAASSSQQGAATSSIAALQAEIVQLTAELQTLLAAHTADASSTPSASPVSCTIALPLGPGSKGVEVSCLQQLLVAQGLLPADDVTGYFGALTQAAVQTLQSQNGIVSSGTPETTGYGAVGPRTRAIINSLLASDALVGAGTGASSAVSVITPSGSGGTASASSVTSPAQNGMGEGSASGASGGMPNANAPAIFNITQDSVTAGDSVTIAGTNFTPTGNQVFLNSREIAVLPSANEATLQFTVPATTTPATYTVTVENSNGTSAGSYLIVAFAENPTWQSYMDFFIQDVCLDANGNVLMGVSPIDGNPACVSERDLEPGENVTYWLAQTPAAKQASTYPVGSVHQVDIPIVFPALGGLSALTLIDSGANGDSFGVRDPMDSALALYTQSSTTISSGATSDHSGSTLYVGTTCISNVTNPIARYDTAWADLDSSVLTQRANTFSLQYRGNAMTPGPCPTNTSTIQRQWYFTTMTFKTDFGAKTTPPLNVLVVQSAKNTSSQHVEVQFFTRELGEVRWEGWDNLAEKSASSAAQLRQVAAQLEASGACTDLSGASGDDQLDTPPVSGGDWVTTGCWQATNIVPPNNTNTGDYPTAWINQLESSDLYAPLFGTTPAPAPTVTNISPASGPPGTVVTITGANFGTHDVVDLNQFLASPILTSSSGTSLTFTLPQTLNKVTLQPGAYDLSVYSDDSSSYSASTSFTVTATSTTGAGQSESALGWLIQDVCTDASGNVIPNLSPLDPGCTSMRDLEIGEDLPYHKQDLSTSQSTIEQEDSVPVSTAMGEASMVIEDRAPFGVDDYGDGAQLAVVYASSSNPALNTISWIGGTDHDGVDAYEGALCTSFAQDDPRTMLDSWVLAEVTPSGDLVPSGGMYTTIRTWDHGAFACPTSAQMNNTYTQWVTQPIAYTFEHNGATLTKTLTTLITTHASTADSHAERNFFTQEFGRMIWESWYNTRTNPGEATSTTLAEDCPDWTQYPNVPFPGSNQPGDNWVLVGCREMTNIVPTQRNSGLDLPPVLNGPDNFLKDMQYSSLMNNVFGITTVRNPICALSTATNQNGTLLLVWGSEYAYAGTITDGTNIIVSLGGTNGSGIGNGQVSINPSITTTYTATVTSPDGTKTGTCSITVSP